MSQMTVPPPPPIAPAQRPAMRPARPDRRFASFRAIGALVLREMATTYGRSPGGYAWALVEPVIGVAILTTAFSFFITRPPIGTSFQLFFATGMVPFLMWMSVTNKIGSTLIFSRPLLVYPAVTFVDALAARFIVNFLTELMVFYVIMSGVLLVYETRSVIDPMRLMQAIALLALVSFAIGTMNAYLFMRFHLWHQIWSIITRPMMLISGVMSTFDALPKFLQDYLWWNPLVHIVGLVRMGFYPNYSGDYISVPYLIGLSLVLIALGFLMLETYGRKLLSEG